MFFSGVKLIMDKGLIIMDRNNGSAWSNMMIN